MWTIYMEEVKKHGESSTSSWKEDANGIIIFVSFTPPILPVHALTSWKTSLFSAATVAAFIIESYKKLSPDTGDQTTVLLGQTSRPLAELANNTDPLQPTTQLFSPSASSTCVNAMWLTSLILSITAALFATLLQRWSRKYMEKPRIPSVPSQRARPIVLVPWCLEVQTAPCSRDSSDAPSPLNIPVFRWPRRILHSDQQDGSHRSVHFRRTLRSSLLHAHHSSFPCRALRSLRRLHRCLVPHNLGEVTSPRERKLVKWLRILEDAVKKQRYPLKNGFGKGIIRGVLDAPVDVDRKALTVRPIRAGGRQK